jgi:F-type H+-transporting ATPase subunit b
MLRSVCGKKYITQAVAVRLLGPAYFQRTESSLVPDFEERKKQYLEDLKVEFPKPYDGPERDLENFPRRVRPMEPGKVRFGFLPDEWFTFFHKKTGVTGPYMFGTGLLTFLLSKEFYVMEEEFSTGVAIFFLIYVAIKKFGPATKSFAEKSVKEEEQHYENEKTKAIEEMQQSIDEQKKFLWHSACEKTIMEAKRENVLMQLETEYRRRLMNVYDQTKRRLDYHLELYNTKRKLEQTHMVDWIVNSVVKSITPEQEKEALKKCIEDLNSLAAKVY